MIIFNIKNEHYRNNRKCRINHWNMLWIIFTNTTGLPNIHYKSANDLSTKTLMINITANSCFLFYTIVHEQYPIMFNCLSVITLESSLIYMKKKYDKIKKSSSETSLVDMDQIT